MLHLNESKVKSPIQSPVQFYSIQLTHPVCQSRRLFDHVLSPRSRNEAKLVCSLNDNAVFSATVFSNSDISDHLRFLLLKENG